MGIHQECSACTSNPSEARTDVEHEQVAEQVTEQAPNDLSGRSLHCAALALYTVAIYCIPYEHVCVHNHIRTGCGP